MAPFLLAAMTQTGSTAWIVAGWISLAVAFACAGTILWDIFGRGNRAEMAVMNWVWPITALYWGPVALYFYATRERERGDWFSVAKGVGHCGAGCTLGDIAAEWIVYLTAWSIPIFAAESADTLMAMFAAAFVLAWSFGIAGLLAAAAEHRQPHLLDDDAGRDDRRLLHRLAGQRLADPARLEGVDVRDRLREWLLGSSGPRLLELGSHTALLYTFEGRRGDLTCRAFLTSLYTEQEGERRLVLHQQTPL